MARPTKRKGSSFNQFRHRLPAELRSAAIGRTFVCPVGEHEVAVVIGPKTQVVQFSLRARDPAEAKVRHAVALERFLVFLRSLREGPVRLAQKQVVALSGEVYRELVGQFEDDPGDADRWNYVAELLRNVPGIISASDDDRTALLQRLLARNGIDPDLETAERLTIEARRAILEAAERLRANAEGDYSADKNALRFPPLEVKPAPAPTAVAAANVTLTGLVEGWWHESKLGGSAKPSTHANYSNTMKHLSAFLGHDDAARVTQQDIVDFKDYRLTTPSPRTGKVVSARTVKDTDLAGLKSVFKWAVENHKLPTNPAEGITVRLSKKAKKNARRGYTEEEALTILTACVRVERSERELDQTFLAKRWVPWVLAYTGARVGEITQLRKQDIRFSADHWEIQIDPEAGTVKTDEARVVPIHPDLVERGFVEFARSAPEGYLFVKPNAETGDVLGPLNGVNNRVREFVRTHVNDPKVDPNHGWRHLFITRCRRAGVDAELRRMITGHAGEGVDERLYGDPAGLYREIRKLPRFDVR